MSLQDRRRQLIEFWSHVRNALIKAGAFITIIFACMIDTESTAAFIIVLIGLAVGIISCICSMLVEGYILGNLVEEDDDFDNLFIV